jgi:cell division protein FtsI (penicillin-binding protein 3)
MDIKNEVLYRVYILLFGIIVPMAILLVYKTVHISYWEGEEWRKKGKALYIQYRPVEAARGNIMAEDGSLLATSIPFFDIYFDPNSKGMSDKDFEENLDTLAQCLATHVDDSYTVGGFRQHLLEEREAGNQFMLIKKKVSYSEKKRIEQFPLFNLGQMRGGFIAEKRSERKRPFGLLAQRTIGYVRDGAKPVGLEGYFDDLLGGKAGKQLSILVDEKRNLWKPVDDLTQVEPKSGDDILTTIDINLQDITQDALLRGMNYHDAEWGTAVLMEVETGAIRAIANLGRTKDGWWETYNHAVGSAIEPGSTFKLASIMALLEDEYVNLQDSIDIQKGTMEFYEETMVDASPYSFKIDTTTVKHAFEISSNVGIASLVNKYYGKKEKINKEEGAARFIQRLKDFNLHLPTGIQIGGEANPYIKEAYSEEDQWSGITLPWMSTGYELRLTPLQLLQFYNAVANDGQMMKPYLVAEIQRFGEKLETFKPTVIKRNIASKKTIAQAKELLEAVVENGTAHKLKTNEYRFAGKTGTAQINYRKSARRRRIGGYQASFVGYFPAEKPKYSCIVVVYKPRQNGIYGGDVAGPIFREIADKCFDSKIELHEPMNFMPRGPLTSRQLPKNDIGKKEDIQTILNYLEIPFYGNPSTAMAVTSNQADSLLLQRRSVPNESLVPNVVGMGLRDALYILENRKLRVEVKGFGKVIQQSIIPGTKVQGQTIRLTLG